METLSKLKALETVAAHFNQNQLCWAVGGSLLLYFKSIVPSFQDIDIMLAEADAPRAKQLLDALGQRIDTPPNPHYKTRFFYEYLIGGTEFDIIAGFVIHSGGQNHSFSLQPSSIQGSTRLGGVTIPLQSLESWLEYYRLMGRAEKVRLIQQHLAQTP